MKKVIILLFLIFLISGCAQNAQIANPASVYCEENWGKLEIRTDTSGNQVGYCKFENGKECEEWAYYRGECSKEIKTESTVNSGKTYDFYIKGTERDDTTAICTITSKLTNLDTIKHKFHVTSNILLDGIESDSEDEYIILNAGESRFLAYPFECPDNKKYKLNTEVNLV